MRQRVPVYANNVDASGFFNLPTGPQLLDEVETLLPEHRERVFPPTETLSIFLAQVLCADASCRHAVDDAAVKLVPDREGFIRAEDGDKLNELLRSPARTGRPLDSDAFVESPQRQLARTLKRKKPGPKTQERDRYTGDRFGNGSGIE